MIETDLFRVALKREREQSADAENSPWKSVIESLIDPASDMTEDEKKEYEKKIVQKMKMGKRLTSEEMNFLRIHNPELYKAAMRVEIMRKSLQSRLKNCKSKDEVNSVIMGQMGSLRAMKQDPAREYMIAMVSRVVQKFKESGAFARLPEETRTGKKSRKSVSVQAEDWEEKDGEDKTNTFYLFSFLTSLQCDCEQIDRLCGDMLAFGQHEGGSYAM